jgi:hypothetical protein
MAGETFDRSTNALADVGNFQAIYERVMGIPEAGRNLYNNWLASRWKEAAANWALETSADLNITMDADGNPVGVGANVGESFEDYMNRLKDSEELFGAVGDGGGTVGGGVQGRLNQIKGYGGQAQNTIIDNLSDMLSNAGLSGTDAVNEAFLNAMQGRFGRRGGAAITNSALSPARYRAFAIAPDGALDPTNNESFLNQRLAALRTKYGF